MSKAMKVLTAHIASQRAFHKAMVDAQGGMAAGSRAAHSAALDDCDKTLDMCKSVEDELGKADKVVAENVEGKIQQMIAEQLLKALGDQVVRGPGISRLAPPAPTSRAVPRFGAPEPTKIEIPVELEKVLGRNPEYLDEV